MASSSETGQNKNVANFSSAYQILEEMGTLYNPSNSKITLPNLVPKKAALTSVMKGLNDKKPVYKNIVAKREVEIEPIGKLATTTLNFAKSLDISAKDKENLESLAKKIRGDVKPKKINLRNKRKR